MSEWFKDWFNSPYYHRLYAYRDAEEAAAFIDRIIEKLDPPAGAFMLDLACGKGRHARQLASKGFDVTGIDLSTESIREAEKTSTDRLTFYVHDMRLPFRINYFDIVFNLFTSFGYFETEREHLNALKTVSNALKPGGLFVLDFLNVVYSERRGNEHTEKDIQGAHYVIDKKTDAEHFYKKISVTAPELPHALSYEERVRKFGLEDFKSMFGKVSLEITQLFGDYMLHPFDAQQSNRLIIVAKKI